MTEGILQKAYSRCPALVALATLIAGVSFSAERMKKVSTAEAMAAVINKVHPEYPPVARQLKLQGTVEIGIVIDESGNVEKADAINGNPVLTKPAAAALKKWKFKPFVEDGKQVKAEATLSITFKL
jgi:TonB family protein